MIRLLVYCVCFCYIAVSPAIEIDCEMKGLNKKLAKLQVPYGGCGYMALYIAEYFNTDDIVEFYHGEYSHVHVMVRHRGYYVDVHGFTRVPMIGFIMNYKILTRIQLRKELNRHNEWNKAFKLADTVLLNSINEH